MKSGNKLKLLGKKKQTNRNIVAIGTVILQIKMNVNTADQLYYCNSYIQYKLQFRTAENVRVINNIGDNKASI